MEELATRVAQMSRDERENRKPRDDESTHERRTRLGRNARYKATRGVLGKALKTLASDGGVELTPQQRVDYVSIFVPRATQADARATDRDLVQA
eukprot:1187439-Lingulodinium_polyedra.AAC.1